MVQSHNCVTAKQKCFQASAWIFAVHWIELKPMAAYKREVNVESNRMLWKMVVMQTRI